MAMHPIIKEQLSFYEDMIGKKVRYGNQYKIIEKIKLARGNSFYTFYACFVGGGEANIKKCVTF